LVTVLNTAPQQAEMQAHKGRKQSGHQSPDSMRIYLKRKDELKEILRKRPSIGQRTIAKSARNAM
jgi:hypothetical protein